MKYVTFILLALVMVRAQSESINPEDFRFRSFTAHRLDHPLRVDAQLNEAIYQQPAITNFIQIDPDNGSPATEKTEVWIGYDDDALYVGARCWDSQPDSIVGLLGRRDNFQNSDEFQVAIDAYNDNRSGYFFVVNPSGAVKDGAISNDSRFDDNWDGIWDAHTRIDDQGWTVEMRIPFSQLRFNKQKEYVWGIGLGRRIQRKSEHALITWSPRDEYGIVSKFAYLEGIANINPPRRLEFIPYITSGYDHLPAQNDNPFYHGKDIYRRLGGDIKIGLGSNLTIDATFNPDFGQVESDPATLNLSDFETYYSEKRPFFVEGSSIFNFGSGGPRNQYGFNFSEPDFFYSRRIGQPPHGWANTSGWVKAPTNSTILGATKLSGKIGNDISVGGLFAVTDREFAKINESGEHRRDEIEPLTTYSLIRSLKEYNKGDQGLGIIATGLNRSFKADYLQDILAEQSYGLGVDVWTFFGQDRGWAASGWLGHTRVSGTTTYLENLQQSSQHYFQKPDADHVAVDTTLTTMSGWAGRFLLNKEKGDVIFNLGFGFIDPFFDSNDMGLTFRTDRINAHQVIGYAWRDPGKVLRSAYINLAHSTNHNFVGEKINEMYFFFGGTQLLNYWNFHLFSGIGPRTINDSQLRGGPSVVSPAGYFGNLSVSSDFRKNLVYGTSVRGGGTSYGAYSYGFNLWANLKIGTRFSMKVEPGYRFNRTLDQYIMTIDDSSRVEMYGKRYIVAQLDNETFSASIRLNYTFTPRLSLQAYIQPFVSSGYYTDYKEFARPRSYEFTHYDSTGQRIKFNDETYEYYIGSGGDHDLDPRFRYSSFIANAVLRWEFRPGSTLYFVWTRNASEWNTQGKLDLNSGLNNLLSLTASNLIAIKVTYWFDV